jgi:signal peptidase I
LLWTNRIFALLDRFKMKQQAKFTSQTYSISAPHCLGDTRRMTDSIRGLKGQTEDASGDRRSSDAAFISAVLQHAGRVSLRVYGSSMLPWVRPGDIATIRKISLEQLRCGDLVLYRRAGQLIVHRIVEKRGSLGAVRYIAKGDAHLHSDGVMERDEFLGRVVRIVRGSKCIDLDAPGQLALGLLISQFSLRSQLWFPLASLVAKITRPVRRILRSSSLFNAALR